MIKDFRKMEINRPKQTKQTSRKGKKAWRKNIDIEDIQDGLETVREVERDVGVKDMSMLQTDQLFQVDIDGDEKLKTKKERNSKPMKADEILGRRSKVPALNASHKAKRSQREGLSKKEVHKLLDRAGKNPYSTRNLVERQGLGKAPDYDLWGSEEAKPAKDSFISDLKQATSHNVATVAPKTLKETPLSLKKNREKEDAVSLPHAGKSYNPTIEAWQTLIQEAHENESKREAHRLKLEEEKNRIQLIIENFDDNGELSEDDSDNDEEDEEEEKQDESSNGKESLSVNKPVENKKKLKTQRNKEARHNKRLKLDSQVKALKKQIRDLQNIPLLLKEAEAQIEAALQSNNKAVPGTTKRKSAPKFSRNQNFIETPLEIKLSDELTDSLRLLKPEGNLAIDRFRSLQDRGLIEPRVPAAKRRKYAPKITEKWGYKDIKL